MEDKQNYEIVYYSFSGKTKGFIDKLNQYGLETIQVTEGLTVNKPFVLVTPTYNIGEVPEMVDKFLANNHQHLKAVLASGNKNWGKNYAVAGDIISNKYSVELIGKFEMMGSQKDVEALVNYVVKE